MKPLGMLSRLMEALNVEWELNLFDTDSALAEDNELQAYSGPLGDKKIKRAIPLRCSLLALSYRDVPLNQTTLDILRNSEAIEQKK